MNSHITIGGGRLITESHRYGNNALDVSPYSLLHYQSLGNYANEDEKDYNEDVFTVELIEHAGIYRAVNEPSTDDDDDFASLHEEDEWEMVSHELVHYAEITDLDHAECGSLTTTPFLSTRWENGNDFKEYEEDGYLPNLLYVPTLRKTLLSISRITRHSDEAVLNFKHDYCAVNVKITYPSWQNGTMRTSTRCVVNSSCPVEVNTAVKLGAGLWLARMGHIPADTMTAVGKATTGEPKQAPKQSHARTA
ncbi:hypothetical protein B5M09_012739 [Aphanomyces astaci]|uniref:Uncharacterized protein n=1 Tax=Aphanomyces astaci TaxID=112090 RepID=A0A3R7ZLP2_APHAT|nr:hypothetical protein B5M09_012739 [Aphanomyces astaci]